MSQSQIKIRELLWSSVCFRDNGQIVQEIFTPSGTDKELVAYFTGQQKPVQSLPSPVQPVVQQSAPRPVQSAPAASRPAPVQSASGCPATKKDGTPCGGRVTSSGFCMVHGKGGHPRSKGGSTTAPASQQPPRPSSGTGSRGGKGAYKKRGGDLPVETYNKEEANRCVYRTAKGGQMTVWAVGVHENFRDSGKKGYRLCNPSEETDTTITGACWDTSEDNIVGFIQE